MFVWLGTKPIFRQRGCRGCLKTQTMSCKLIGTTGKDNRDLKIPILPVNRKRLERRKFSKDLGVGNVKMKNSFISHSLFKSRIMIGFIWMSFVVYAFVFAPGSFNNSELLVKLLRNPFDSQINSIFVAIFNGLGVIPCLYSAFLLPEDKSSQFKAWPFLLLSFFLGFFAIGPYLVFRNKRNSVEEVQFSFIFTESIWFRYATLLFSIGLYFVGLKILQLNQESWEVLFLDDWQQFVHLFQNNRLVHVSTVDLFLLSFFLLEPLIEDMKLRGFFRNNLTDKIVLILTWIIPLIGPSIYLCARPILKTGKTSTNK